MSFLKKFFERLLGSKPATPPVQAVENLPPSFSSAPIPTPAPTPEPVPEPAPTPEPVAPPPAPPVLPPAMSDVQPTPTPAPVVEAPKKKRGRPPKKK